MADLSITAANVVAGATGRQDTGTAGESVTAGQVTYHDTADDNHLKKASNASATLAKVKGIALNNAADGQPITVHTSGPLDLGATLTVGENYVVSDTAGGIAPISDLGSGDYVSILGVATAADEIEIQILNSEAAKP